MLRCEFWIKFARKSALKKVLLVWILTSDVTELNMTSFVARTQMFFYPLGLINTAINDLLIPQFTG